MAVLRSALAGLAMLTNTIPSVAGDADDGRNLFLRKCIGCHAFSCNKDGPKLGGLMGRKAGTVEDYGFYTDAVKNSNIVWDEQKLDEFLSDPAAFFPQSTMAASGLIEDAEDRRKLIIFLKTEDPAVNICSG